MRRQGSLKRIRGQRLENRRILIFCEDRNAGRQYLNELRRQHRAAPVTVRLRNGRNGEALSLVKQAVKHRNNAPFSSSDKYTGYDEVWCLVDVEAPRQQSGLDKALKLAATEGIFVALVNPCFELWALLHRSEVNQYLSSRDAQKLIEKHSDIGYCPRTKSLNAQPLMVHRERAADRAYRLRERFADAPLLKANPWTNMDVLMRVVHDGSVETVPDGGVMRCVPIATCPRRKR